MGMTREDAIKHLENMKWLKGYSNTTVDGVPIGNVIDGIIALLKAQEPRVMTDTELEAIRKAPLILKPNVDAVPVVHGRWVKMTGMMPPEYHGHYECSECQWHMKGLRNSWTREEELAYCPNCGAKMDGKRRDDNAAD